MGEAVGEGVDEQGVRAEGGGAGGAGAVERRDARDVVGDVVAVAEQ